MHLEEESSYTDAPNGIFDARTTLSDEVGGEFEELLDGDNDRKCFLKSLSKIFALLLNTKVGTADKIKKNIRIALETTIKIWSG